MSGRPIAKKYSDGKVKRTLKRRSKVLETVKRETNGTGERVAARGRFSGDAVGVASIGFDRGGLRKATLGSYYRSAASRRRIPFAATGRRRIGRADEGMPVRLVCRRRGNSFLHHRRPFTDRLPGRMRPSGPR